MQELVLCTLPVRGKLTPAALNAIFELKPEAIENLQWLRPPYKLGVLELQRLASLETLPQEPPEIGKRYGLLLTFRFLLSGCYYLFLAVGAPPGGGPPLGKLIGFF